MRLQEFADLENDELVVVRLVDGTARREGQVVVIGDDDAGVVDKIDTSRSGDKIASTEKVAPTAAGVVISFCRPRPKDASGYLDNVIVFAALTSSTSP